MKRLLYLAVGLCLCVSCLEDNFELPEEPEPEPEPTVTIDSTLTANRILGAWEVVDGWMEYIQTERVDEGTVQKRVGIELTEIVRDTLTFLRGVYIRPSISYFLGNQLTYVIAGDTIVGEMQLMPDNVYETWTVSGLDGDEMKLSLEGGYKSPLQPESVEVCELSLKRIEE